MDGKLIIYGQEKLTPDARDAALAAAHAILSREGVSAREAVQAAGVDLLLAEGLAPDERTDEYFSEHGATLHAIEAHDAAKDAAAGAVARLDPANTGFAILFSVVG
ncbi:protein of unknown function [uncultured Sphingopyxis sp.]|uniref:Uncharacterized protein n=1 Tax=uncultured Sphingopyxis sp. TaxID=310581 RepID=A0A1Y5PM96_9SPHN|nr:hypothetical protein [uncultured Sphingopyxis sp.]SBV31128.1 protein of unknown function [uncultured Sphingopyxis sp.]